MIEVLLKEENLLAVRRCVNYRLSELLDVLVRIERGKPIGDAFRALRVATVEDIRTEIRELHVLFNSVLT